MNEVALDSTTSPVRQLLADTRFRRFWIAQVLYTGVNGTLRFTFVWLIVTLTDWPSAEGLVAIALGVPPMLLSVPAGAWSDRVDRRRMFLTWTAASIVALAGFTTVIALGWATPLRTGVAALIIGTVTAVNLPNIQAMVPLLVPPERLMNAAALQNGGGQAAGFCGLALGGLAIGLFGDAGGFALVTAATVIAFALMLGVHLPGPSPDTGSLTDPATAPDTSTGPATGTDTATGIAADGEASGSDRSGEVGAPPTSEAERSTGVDATNQPGSARAAGPTGATQPTEPMWAAIVAGARFGLGRDPLRTLLLLSVLLGGSFSVMQVSMPRVVDEVYQRGPAAAGFVLGAFGVGMLVSSAVVAGRQSMRHGLNVARYIGVGLGMGQFLLSLAPGIWVAVAVMVAWGLNAGVAMASHRTLVQSNTPPEMMGRIMGMTMLGFAGALPIGALVSSVLAPRLGPVMTMRWVGLATIVIGVALTWRRPITSLR